jgi:hypothetical protein
MFLHGILRLLHFCLREGSKRIANGLSVAFPLCCARYRCPGYWPIYFERVLRGISELGSKPCDIRNDIQRSSNEIPVGFRLIWKDINPWSENHRL